MEEEFVVSISRQHDKAERSAIVLHSILLSVSLQHVQIRSKVLKRACKYVNQWAEVDKKFDLIAFIALVAVGTLDGFV